MLKESKTIQGATRRCHARQKLMYAEKQIFKRVFKARGFWFIWGPKRGPIHGVGLTIFFVSFVV
jgi:hypothetical protein